jgi:hypothetical protein
LNDIVFVSYNCKMKTRFQTRRENKGKGLDPLVTEEFDWDNEWADSSYVHHQGARGCDFGPENENGLTWELVDEAIAAIFRGQPATNVQEFHTQSHLKLKMRLVQPLK